MRSRIQGVAAERVQCDEIWSFCYAKAKNVPENLEHAVSLHFVHYNFCRPHMSLKGRTPAQAAGLAERKWDVEDLIRLLDS